MKRRKRYRKVLIILFVFDILLITAMSYYEIKNKIPDEYFTFVGTEDSLNLSLPIEITNSVETLSVKNTGSDFQMKSTKKGSYHVDVKLFGFISMKKVNVHVIEQMKVAPSGDPIGIYVETMGLMVLDTGVVEGKDDVTYEPAANILQSGDYILEWNNSKVTSIEQLANIVDENGAKPAKVTIRRKGRTTQVRITPVLSKKGKYKIGVWVREDTQGIGTITYITEDGKFGALGHGITDSDTGVLISVSEGEIFTAKILNIIKGIDGKPGELEGLIQMTSGCKMGNIKKNTPLGIFGTASESVKDQLEDQYLPVAMKQNIRKGKAVIRTRMDGSVKDYEIQIVDVDLTRTDNKGMVIKVTDPKLLKKTGGIVQGMSGSPIIQNGKVIGAVTHVFVNDSSKGYGIFIETMLQAMSNAG